MKIPELIKTSKLGKYQPDLTLPFLKKKSENLCSLGYDKLPSKNWKA